MTIPGYRIILQAARAQVSYSGSRHRTIFSFATDCVAANVDTVRKARIAAGVTVKSTICFPYGTPKGSKINERLGHWPR